jgi:uncharacterized protein Usg
LKKIIKYANIMNPINKNHSQEWTKKINGWISMIDRVHSGKMPSKREWQKMKGEISRYRDFGGNKTT